MIEMVGKKVLIVDDDHRSAKLMKMLIGNSDGIETAANGREGLKKINEHRFDLIISDIHMPEMSGTEMYLEAKKSDPAIKDRLLFFSATCDPKIMLFLRKHDLVLISKPSPARQIRDIVSKILGNK